MSRTELPPVYVNNAGTSWPKPERVLAEVSRGLSTGAWELAPDLEQARRAVRRLLSLPDSGELLWTSGCTAALGIAIENLPWEEGDRVVTSSLEHHAVDGPVQRLVRDRGVVHEASPYAPGSPFDLDWLEKTLRTGNVRLVAFSAASNVTGEILPAKEIAALCRRHGALCLMDAAQTAAVVHIDVEALEIDLLCFAGHKGPLGPQGVGALWMADHVSFACASAVCAIDESQAPKGAQPNYCDSGGVNVAGVIGLAAGLAWLEQHPNAFDEPRARAGRFAEALRAREGVTVFGGSGPRTAAVSFRLDAMDLAEAKARFAAQNIVLGAGAFCAPRALETLGVAAGTLRVSFGVFNAADDETRVLDAVDACLQERP